MTNHKWTEKEKELIKRYCLSILKETEKIPILTHISTNKLNYYMI
jgi:hypothetical protein